MEYKTKKADTIRGIANVRLLKTTVQVRFTDDVETNLDNAGKLLEVSRSDAPALLYEGEFWVALNGRGTILYNIAPVNGDFLFRFKEWKAKEDEVPEPRFDPGGTVVKDRKNGKTWTTRPSMSMDAVLEIVEGRFAGLTCLYMLPYPYVAGDSGNVVVEATSFQMEKLKTWDRATGIADQRFTYEANMLPTLGKAILKANTVFQGEVAKGLVRKVSLPPDGYKPPRVGAAKKAASKRK